LKALSRLAPAFAAALAVTAIAVPVASASAAPRPAPASPAHRPGPKTAGPAVFVMNDNTAANAVAAYHRAADGRLTLAGTYDTRGLGGVLSGSVVDHTASEGALTYDRLWVTTSLRGLVNVHVTVEVMRHGVHSGTAGGVTVRARG